VAYLYLILAFTLNALGNIFLKLGALRGLTLDNTAISTLLSMNWQLLLGVCLFGINILFYFLALRALPLSVAYPVMIAASFLIINGYAYFGLHEPITPVELLGYGLILGGLVLIVGRSH
jgi:multidrug transporter EmrE-like cation transporter